MSDPPEYSLSYSFSINAMDNNMQRGDVIESTCPTTDTETFSPAGFPLSFSLRLVFLQDDPLPHQWFNLQLSVQPPSHVPALPPFHIQPKKGTDGGFVLPFKLDRRLIGPLQPASWTFTTAELTPSASDPYEYQLEGKFQFQLLDEPVTLIAKLPPILSEPDWSSLPQHVIVAIMRQLPLADRVNARLVCHFWSHILDTDSRVWKNITHLESLANRMKRENLFEYHNGGLNQVRHWQLSQALEFLRFRSAPIHSLQLRLDDENELSDVLQSLPAMLPGMGIVLKAFSYHNSHLLHPTAAGVHLLHSEATDLLRNVLESQPRLERLSLKLTHTHFGGVPISVLPVLPHLRILSLDIGELDLECLIKSFRDRVPLFQNLVGLRLMANRFSYPITYIGISDFVTSQTPNLHRVASMSHADGVDASCGCYIHGSSHHSKHLVWGTPDLSPADAAILLLPQHWDCRDRVTPIDHYHC